MVQPSLFVMKPLFNTNATVGFGLLCPPIEKANALLGSRSKYNTAIENTRPQDIQLPALGFICARRRQQVRGEHQ